MKFKLLVSIPLLVLSLISCEEEPIACVEFERHVFPQITYGFEHCSQDYEFVTWEFGDNFGGHVGDTPQRQYTAEGKYVIGLTAYSNGAYKSDRDTHALLVSHMYIDKLELVGSSPFSRIKVQFPNHEKNYDIEANKEYTENDPLILLPFTNLQQVTPSGSVRIIPGVGNDFFGEELNEEYDLVIDKTQRVVPVKNETWEMKIHWKFRTFE